MKIETRELTELFLSLDEQKRMEVIRLARYLLQQQEESCAEAHQDENIEK